MSIEFDEDALPPVLPTGIKAGSEFTGKELQALIQVRPVFGDTRDSRIQHPEDFISGRHARSIEVRKPRAPKAPAEPDKVPRVMVDRADPDMQAALDADPIKFIQSELSRALIAEAMINRELYAHESVDSMALSSSNKRMVELADAMKTLPKQNEGARGKNQKSSAELIEDAMDEYDSTATDKLRTDAEAASLDRAGGSFDEDE